MYIFTNMFIAEVMQKFSYVYPTAQITRDDTRSFKKAWDKIDVDHNGRLEEKELENFFGVSVEGERQRWRGHGFSVNPGEILTFDHTFRILFLLGIGTKRRLRGADIQRGTINCPTNGNTRDTFN
jgi:hypothetical protein